MGKEDFLIILFSTLGIQEEKERNRLFGKFVEKEIFRTLLLNLIEEDCRVLEEDSLLEIVSSYSDSYNQFLPYKILYYHKNKYNIEELWKQYFAKEKNVLFMNEELMNIFTEKIDMLEYASQLSLEVWMEKISIFVKKASVDTLLNVYRICKSYNQNDIRLCNLKEMCLEKILKSKEVEKFNFSDMESLFIEYVNSTLSLFKQIYKEEVFESELSIYLPESCRFCYMIKEIFDDKMDDLTKARMIRDAVDIYPDLASFCKIYIEKMQNETKAATDEFLQLAVMIKQSIRTYIAMGQMENARITLQQLEQLIPNDSEIAELKKIILSR